MMISTGRKTSVMEIFIVHFKEKRRLFGITFLKDYYMYNISPRALWVSRLEMMRENIEGTIFIAFNRDSFKRDINDGYSCLKIRI